jgi:hypothetical protein
MMLLPAGQQAKVVGDAVQGDGQGTHRRRKIHGVGQALHRLKEIVRFVECQTGQLREVGYHAGVVLGVGVEAGTSGRATDAQAA